ncbi:MAG: energy transducer TonB [Alphaproteobacteria bacterium]
MVRLRLFSMILATVVCATIAYLAITQKFSAITDLFTDTNAVKVQIEQKKPPPPPPPPPNRPPPPPPPEMRVPPPDITAPPTPTPIPVAVDPPPAPPSPILTGVTWTQRPNGADFSRFFPPRALDRGMEGTVTLDCLVSADGHISCTVASEDPPGWGFGDASLRISRLFRLAPQTADGRQTSGGRIHVPIRWAVQ